jgi:ferredoxin
MAATSKAAARPAGTEHIGKSFRTHSRTKGSRRLWQFFVVNVPSLFENNTDRLLALSANQETTRSGLLQVSSGRASINHQAHEMHSPNPANEAPTMSDTERRFSIAIEPAGWQFDAPASLPLLRSAAAAGIVLPSSCRNGTCRACMCRLRSGQVRYEIEWPGLSVDEKRDGYILPCVAFPESDLVVEARHARRADMPDSA